MSGWQPQMQASSISSKTEFTEVFSTATLVSFSYLEKLCFGLHTRSKDGCSWHMKSDGSTPFLGTALVPGLFHSAHPTQQLPTLAELKY